MTAHNHSVQRTGASRFALSQIERHRRLAPVADLVVSPPASHDLHIMDAPVASLKLVEVAPGGTRTAIHVEVGCPRPDGRGAWACPIFVDGLDSKPRDIYGQDSLQALCLGLCLVRTHLEGVLERGSRLIHDDDASEFPLDAYFGDLSDGDTKSSG